MVGLGVLEYNIRRGEKSPFFIFTIYLDKLTSSMVSLDIELRERGNIMEETRGTILAKEFGNYANSFNPDREGFVKGIRNEHRTLQQEIMRTFVELVNAWSKDYEDGRYDLRNEQTVILANEFSKIAKESYLPMI